MLYYARLEAYYRDVPDLLVLPARKYLNLVLHWMMEHTDGEVWEKEFRPTFFPKDGELPQAASTAKMADAKPGVEGSLNIERKAEPIKVTNDDLAQFFGRAGGAGKSDNNKALLREKAQRPRRSVTIAPDADGNLSMDDPDRA